MKKYVMMLGLLMAMAACDKNKNFVLFSPDDDIALGQQVSQEIANDPSYKILPPSQYPDVYNYLNGMRDAILNSGELAYKDKFSWQLHVIQNDTVLNAFATPGGYIYIYTGLIKYLDHADDLAGVLGHEMAHSDERHSVRNLQKMYGLDLMLSIALGQNPGALEQVAGQIAGTLAGLKFSREFETEADENSVRYLSHTQYACNGAALFFIKLNENSDGGQPPEFLSTHPNPDNRIQNINAEADKLKCDKTLSGDTGYQTLKNSLPGN
jgi:beta-barrel assembly-enhancing protease